MLFRSDAVKIRLPDLAGAPLLAVGIEARLSDESAVARLLRTAAGCGG